MTLIGDTKEEDREIFAAMNAHAQHVRAKRHENALEYIPRVKELADGGTFFIDPNFTWNMKLKGIRIQYWPTKGRWQYTDPKLIARAKQLAKKAGKNHYSYETRMTQWGGGIHKFIKWLEYRQ